MDHTKLDKNLIISKNEKFLKEHKKRFARQGSKILIEMLTVEAIGKSTEQENFIGIKDPDYNAQPIDQKMFVDSVEKNK